MQHREVMQTMLAQMMRHLTWADQRVVASLRTCPGVPDEARRLFTHIAMTEQIYLLRMQAKDPFPQDFWPDLDVATAARVAEDAGKSLQAFVQDQDAASLQRPVRYRNSKGTYFETPLAQMLTHLALHGERHRGQIARLVRSAGGTPALTDFIVFVRAEDRSN